MPAISTKNKEGYGALEDEEDYGKIPFFREAKSGGVCKGRTGVKVVGALALALVLALVLYLALHDSGVSGNNLIQREFPVAFNSTLVVFIF